MPMMRQSIYRGLILGVLIASGSGCESLHSMVRPHDKDVATSKDDNEDPANPKAVGSDASKASSVDSTDKDQRPFFSKKYSSSSFSSFSPEARQIEKDLGVY
jgi:hypothetical protein